MIIRTARTRNRVRTMINLVDETTI